MSNAEERALYGDEFVDGVQAIENYCRFADKTECISLLLSELFEREYDRLNDILADERVFHPTLFEELVRRSWRIGDRFLEASRLTEELRAYRCLRHLLLECQGWRRT
jgi:hypothetical protein